MLKQIQVKFLERVKLEYSDEEPDVQCQYGEFYLAERDVGIMNPCYVLNNTKGYIEEKPESWLAYLENLICEFSDKFCDYDDDRREKITKFVMSRLV